MSKKKNTMIGKAVEWQDGRETGKGIIRDRYKDATGQPIYLLEEESGKISRVHSSYLTRFILIMIVLAIGFYTFS